MAVPTRIRRTADERREEILQAAVAEFAIGGLHNTSTETIAARAGISQPYLFRLFATKKELFIAAFTRCCETIQGAFEDAVAALPDGASPDEKLGAMGEAYVELIGNPALLRVQMQGFTASASDPEVGAAGRAGFARLFRRVEELTGAGEEQVMAFFAQGMLLSVSASLGHDTKSKDAKSWAAALRRGR
jgi:AcrR family transcriptional regulator